MEARGSTLWCAAWPRAGASAGLVAAPGNAGIAHDAEIVAVGAEDVPGLVALVERERFDLVVVGPEAPLVAGLADQSAGRGVSRCSVPGPTARASRGPRPSPRRSCRRRGCRPAGPRPSPTTTRLWPICASTGAPAVIKADGLAAGKGVIVAKTLAEAEAALEECFVERRFGEAADTVLIEEYLEGEEVSLLALVSGEQVLPLAPAQDYKRALDGDQGPNTGGMGSYSPVPAVDASALRASGGRSRAAHGRRAGRRGIDFRGVLYAGLMLTAERPQGAGVQLSLRRP